MKNIRFWTVLGILSVSIVSALSYNSISKADTGLLSKGRIEYKNPTNEDEGIIIDSADHTYLKENLDICADEIFTLKTNMAEQTLLQNQLNTKVTALEQNISSSEDLWTDENGLTLHDKLDMIISGSGVAGKVEIVYLGNEREFNITDIVGAENIGKYTMNDFIVGFDLPTESTRVGTNSVGVQYLNKHSDFVVSYNNATGDVIITKGEVFFNRSGPNYASDTAVFELPPRVYLCVKSDEDEMPEGWHYVYAPTADKIIDGNITLPYSLAYQTVTPIPVNNINKIKLICDNYGANPVNIYVYSDENRTNQLDILNGLSAIELNVSEYDTIYLYATNCGSQINSVKIIAIN